MPKGGSVNQIEPSDLQTMSFGELSGLLSKRSAMTVIEPSYSVRVTRRVSCSGASDFEEVVVGGVGGLVAEAVGDARDGAVVLGARHPPRVVLAGEQPSLP